MTIIILQMKKMKGWVKKYDSKNLLIKDQILTKSKKEDGEKN